jgi:subtilase family serine protease
MEPVSAIIAAVLTAGATIFSKTGSKKERLPDWLSPKDFQQSDRTVQYLILAIAIALITIIVLVVIKQRKR